MKNKFLSLIYILYSIIIGFVWFNKTINNFLAPQMQIYLKISFFVLLIIGIVTLNTKKLHYKFKISALILILPFIMIIFAKDGNLTTSFASNRNINMNIKNIKKIETNIKKEIEYDETIDINEYDFSNIFFDIQDDNYFDLSGYLTYNPRTFKYENSTIRVRGFTDTTSKYIPKGHFALGKYGISCCAADAGFVGFIVKQGDYTIKNNSWYEVEGVLKKAKDASNHEIMVIIIKDIQEIDSDNESQYVYPCYAYGDNLCLQITKYDLN